MTIREMIAAAGMSQQQFAAYFSIPLRTIESWVSTSSSGRSCPDYLAHLMEYKLRSEGKITQG